MALFTRNKCHGDVDCMWPDTSLNSNVPTWTWYIKKPSETSVFTAKFNNIVFTELILQKSSEKNTNHCGSGDPESVVLFQTVVSYR